VLLEHSKIWLVLKKREHARLLEVYRIIDTEVVAELRQLADHADGLIRTFPFSFTSSQLEVDL
jgi:hypothetical protein